jgi:hypothetical protein
MTPRGTTFEFEYLGEFEKEIKNILGHESGAYMRLIHEKNQRPKIACYCTFKVKGNLLLKEKNPVQRLRQKLELIHIHGAPAANN